MINLAQKMIFTARARHCRRQFGVGERTAHRANSAHAPERNNGEPGRQITNLKPQEGEDARADHVRDHDARGGEERNAWRFAHHEWSLYDEAFDLKRTS